MSLYNRIAHPQTNSTTVTPASSFSAYSAASPEKLQQLVEEFKAKGDLSDDEKMWLSKECIARFLIATKNDVAQTRTRLIKCLEFRNSWSLFDVPQMASYVSPESPCGKEFLLGYDAKNRPVLYFFPNRSNTEVSERQMRHTVYMMERTIDMMPAGVSNLCLVIDLAGKKQAPTSMGQAKLFVEILGSHYPERLGTAVILNLPWMVKRFLDIVFKFVDPVTKAKVSWNSAFVKDGLLPKPTALTDHGGDLPFAYDHDEYWPTLFKASMDKRDQYKKSWKALGGTVGISEYDYKTYNGQTSTSAAQPQPEATQAKRPIATTTISQVAVETAPGPPKTTTASSTSSGSENATLHESHGLNDPDVQDGHLKSGHDLGARMDEMRISEHAKA